MMILKGMKVAILAEKLYHELELFHPYYRLIEEEVDVTIVGINDQTQYQGKLSQYPLKVDQDIKEVKADDFDGVVIPGGYSPEFLRVNTDVLQFVYNLNYQNKLIAAICHGGWVLASAEIIRDKKVTSHPNIRHDLIHAGGQFMDQAVVVDSNLITSRLPHDLPYFSRAIIQYLNRR